MKFPSMSEIKDMIKWHKLALRYDVYGDGAYQNRSLYRQLGQIGDYHEQKPTSYVQSLYEESSAAKQRLGTVRELDDGRRFRYIGITAAALTASATLLSKVQAPVDATIAAADAAIDLVGVREITLTIAGATAGLYTDGFLAIKAGADIGTLYKVRGNAATNNPATGRAWFHLYDKLYKTWVAANTTVAAHQNPYKNLLLNPAVANEAATSQETVMGMNIRPMTASYFGWAQTKGIANLVLDIDAAAGAEANEMVVVPGTTAGRGAVIADTAYAGGTQIIGHILESADLTDAEGNLVVLCIE